MRWTRVTAFVASAALLAGILASLSCTSSPPATPAAMTAEEKIARGKMLVHATGCVDCHTPGSFYGAPDTTRMLSGSDIGWQGPWGTTYARNLTPDMEHGIGSWTEEQIVTAFTEGRRPDGSPVLPPMPWTSFAHLPDEDAAAIAAYLKSIPAVPHRSPDRGAPGAAMAGSVIVVPPPPTWDAQNLPPPPAAGGGTGH